MCAPGPQGPPAPQAPFVVVDSSVVVVDSSVVEVDSSVVVNSMDFTVVVDGGFQIWEKYGKIWLKVFHFQC
jgi:hypothetical protein